MTIAAPSLPEAMFLEIRRWNLAAMEPTHVVVSESVLDDLARESHGEWADMRTMRVWGFPLVVVPQMPAGTWGIGSTNPLDAKRFARESPSQPITGDQP